MNVEVDLSRLRASWTKYDIVRVMEVIESPQILEKFRNKEAGIDEPILRAFLGVNSLKDPLPIYWTEIQSYPKEKKLFALFATIFTHEIIIKEFAQKYSTGDMKGLFKVEDGKQYTNIRSALIESGAAEPIYRRTIEVPYDFSPIFHNPEVGKLFKLLLLDRISKLIKTELTESDFYDICFKYNFHKALSLNENQFKLWLQGKSDLDNNYVEKVSISNFYSVEKVELDFAGSKEIYFLGENGDGKSLILMAIYLAFNGNYITEKTNQEKTGKVSDILRDNKGLELTGFDDRGKEYNPKKGIYLNNLYGYGTHRGRYSTEKAEEYGCMSLFDTEQTLINPTVWLKDQKLLEFEKEVNINNMFIDIKKLPNSFSVNSLETIFYDLLERNVEIKIEGNDVIFKEKNYSLNFDQLSEGYKSIMIFVSDLIYRFNLNAKEGVKIADLKGIVLVDEIDLHLHPKWQRVIIKKLRKLFPNIQFIFTTHSPTMIQGASEDAIIYRVYRNSNDGKTRVSDPYYRKDLDHMMINTLLTSPLFGLDDSRMNPEDDNADTSDTYLLYRINKKLEEELEKQKLEGKQFVKDEDIDNMIQLIINEELGGDDKNK